jgi:hypothetical protein
VGVVLPPRLALLGEAAARDPPGRHGAAAAAAAALRFGSGRGGGEWSREARAVGRLAFVYLTPPTVFSADLK